MKFTLSLCISVLLSVTLLGAFPLNGEEAIYGSMIRLHVLAASDGAADQETKLAVRDAVLAVLAEEMRTAEDTAAAKEKITEALPRIREAANTVAPAEVYFTREMYPERVYEGFTLPAGEYTSLRVVVGEGEGRNWWCVLFPQLCLSPASEDTAEAEFIAAGFTPEQYRLVRRESGTKYKIRFRILELLASLAGWEY